MGGIYIHIPFCRKACIYCDFHFSTSLRYKSDMVNAICREIVDRKEFLPDGKLQSIYFGGGTPSLLAPEELQRIFDTVGNNFEVDPAAEITLEANPDDLSSEKLKELRRTPVNRLSVGVQSFRDIDLKMMNRSHNADQAVESIKDARDMGFENISLDLIYAIPGMNKREWREQIDKALELGVPHISSYALTVEPATVLSHKIMKGEISEVGDDIASDQFEILWKALIEAGFEHYELSNFALPGYRAVHNSSYWRGRPYLGVGPAAHSYRRDIRQWNVSNNPRYIKGINSGNPEFESEELKRKDRFNELVMTSLRTKEGLPLEEVKKAFREEYACLEKETIPLIGQGKLVREGGYLYIPQTWRFHSDGIAASLFRVE